MPPSAAVGSPTPVPHSEDCDSLDCPCYRNGQDDVLAAIRVLDRLGMTEARDRILASAPMPDVDESPDADGRPCPECGVPFGERPDPLSPPCPYCKATDGRPSPPLGSGVPKP